MAMQVVSVTGYQSSSKNVIISGTDGVSDEAVKYFALEAANLTMANVFGIRIIRSDDTARVRIDVD